MKSSFIRKTALAAVAALALGAGTAQASSGAPKPPSQDWTFDGIFGHYDQAQLKRGFQVFKEICNACHSLNLIYYRNLMEIGLTEDEVKAIAAEYQTLAGPDEEGNVIVDGDFRTRAAVPADRFNAPFRNPQAARAANGGALPPDLSLITKARKVGPDYVYALLTGYKDAAPEGITIPDDKYFNEYFPGHAISMAPPLMDDSVTFEDGTPAPLPQIARDVVTFLEWAAEPELQERKSLGLKVMLFLIVLTALMFALKKQIWRDVH